MWWGLTSTEGLLQIGTNKCKTTVIQIPILFLIFSGTVISEHRDVLNGQVPVMFDCYRVHRLTRATTGVNFINVLRAALMLVDPESVLIDNLIVIFTHLGSGRIKAVHNC